MTQLTDTQKTILETAANRPDGAIHPLPDRIRGGAEKKVTDSLKSKGLAEYQDGNENLPLQITDAGRAAISLDQKPVEKNFETDVSKAEQNLSIVPAIEETPNTTNNPKEPRPGTKKARMLEMMRRKDGATTKQIMNETGWSNPTVRGAISLAKKAGWNITTNKNRVVGPNQVGSPGSSTTYFLAVNA